MPNVAKEACMYEWLIEAVYYAPQLVGILTILAIIGCMMVVIYLLMGAVELLHKIFRI